MKSVVPPKAHPILATLEYFRHLQTGCFGWDLCTDYKERIQSFTKSVETLHYYTKTFLKLKVTIPWKLHMVCCHLEPLLTKMGRGLAIFSEQAGEAVHCKFKKPKLGTTRISTIPDMARIRKQLLYIGLAGMCSQ